MLFSSYTFVFGFLPVVLALWLLLARAPLAARTGWLLVASLFFYGWFEPRYLLLMGLSILGNHLIAGAILAAGGSSTPPGRRWLALGIAGNLIALAYFKYAQFLLDTVNLTTGSSWSAGGILLPLAISFFTFQQIAYLVDVSRDGEGLYPLAPYALFVSFFPQLIAGPIVHHKELLPQLERGSPRPLRSDLAVGLSIFIVGLAKKSLIADSLAPGADSVFDTVAQGALPGTLDAWLGCLCYTFQIYFDFSGYSDMAIGLARMFGVQLPVNFNSPYKSRNIQEFWRRWHITLSRFLRDYLYIPLGGNQRGERRRLINLALTMLLGGLWHGAGWNFVIWGGLHGLYLVIQRSLSRSAWVQAIPPIGAWLLTLASVGIAWVFFRATTFAAAVQMFGALSGLLRPGWSSALVGPWTIAWLIVAMSVAFFLPNTQQIFHRWEPALGHDDLLPVLSGRCHCSAHPGT